MSKKKKKKSKSNPIAKQLRKLGHRVIPNKKYVDKNFKFWNWDDSRYEDKQ